MVKRIRKTSATTFLLLALAPYTETNAKLTFESNLFFSSLDKLTEHSMSNIKIAYNRAIKKGWIKINKNKVKLSLEARQSIQPFIAKKLPGIQLMVIFDIPEDLARTRQRFRNLLKHFEFKQVQQSVWMSDRDNKDIIIETINNLHLNDYVKVYESVKCYRV